MFTEWCHVRRLGRAWFTESSQWTSYCCFVAVEIEASSGCDTSLRPHRVWSDGVRIWTLAIWLKVSYATCVVRKRGEVAESSLHETAWLLWNTPFTSLNTSCMFLFLLLSYFKMFISTVSVFWSPPVPSKPRGLVPSWVKMSVSSPLLELSFSPLKVSFTEFFLVHMFVSPSLVFFPGGSDCLQYRRPRFDPWVGKIPWRREWLPTPVFLAGEFHGQRRAWQATVQGVAKSQTWLSD